MITTNLRCANVYNGKTYYYQATNGDWNGYYLSCNANGYIGAFGWWNAVAWEQDDDGCLTVHGTDWKTYEYAEVYVVVDDSENIIYKEKCLQLVN